ncbi:MAG: Nif3-like dinuclear metal center hexameric protein [Gemmatimonadaceae bacterium]|nr:Nif3-like dinuclear metal center hexameric protein [Gemmatimonadaceae bacterium]
MAKLTDVVAHLDTLLNTAEIPDYPPALNGLQMENRGDVTRVAVAVDFSLRTVEGAVAAGANLLVVHHGMFWGGLRAITGTHYTRISLLLQHDIAVYATHLPLDVHATLGNNALLATELGLEVTGGFARYQTIEVGVQGRCDCSTTQLVERARTLARQHGGEVVATPHDPARRTRRYAVCTGAGASSDTIREALANGVDTLIVGEGPHHTGVEAADAGLVIIYAGHYATETLGVKALGAHLEREFGLPWSFLDLPTGL